MKLFAKLAKINADHFDNHPNAHKALIAASGSVALVGWYKLNKCLASEFNVENPHK